jgi:hypothetical protein
MLWGVFNMLLIIVMGAAATAYFLSHEKLYEALSCAVIVALAVWLGRMMLP